MKKVLLAGAAAATLTAAGLALPASASAAPTAAPSAVTAASCVFHEKAKTAINIRTSKSVKATAVGVLPKGKKVCSDALKKGGKYNYKGACKARKGANNWWDHITYKPSKSRTIKGWVPSSCLTSV